MIHLRVTEEKAIPLKVEEDKSYILRVKDSISSSDIPYFEGPYEVTPHTKKEIVLDTANKQMAKDVTVFKIPYFETSNVKDGYTVYIGEV